MKKDESEEELQVVNPLNNLNTQASVIELDEESDESKKSGYDSLVDEKEALFLNKMP